MNLLEAKQLNPVLLNDTINGGPGIRLSFFTNDIPVTQDTVLADLVEIDAPWFFAPFLDFNSSQVGEKGQLYRFSRDQNVERGNDSDTPNLRTFGWMIILTSSPDEQLCAAGNDIIDWDFPDQWMIFWFSCIPDLGILQGAKLNL